MTNKNWFMILGVVAVVVVIGLVTADREDVDDSGDPDPGLIVLDDAENRDDTDDAMAESEKAVKEFDVVGTPFQFSQDEIRVSVGDVVRINFENGQGTHDWVIDEFGARTPIIKTGETASVEFTVDQAGEFEYYCSVGNHRALGMVGKLIVE